MSPVTSSGQWYRGPETASRFDLGLQVMTADFQTAAINAENAYAIDATLHVGENLRTSLAGTNNDLDYVGRGTDTDIAVAYIVAGLSTPLSVTTNTSGGRNIVVNVATDGAGAATSTAAQVRAAVQGNATASGWVAVANAAGNDGTGVVAALASTGLAAPSGTPTLDVKMQGSYDGTNWYDLAPVFPQQTTVLGDTRRMIGPLPSLVRWFVDVGATTVIGAGIVGTTARIAR